MFLLTAESERPHREREHSTAEALHGAPADPIEILMRQEITIGINIRGNKIPNRVRRAIAITLNIDLDDE